MVIFHSYVSLPEGIMFDHHFHPDPGTPQGRLALGIESAQKGADAKGSNAAYRGQNEGAASEELSIIIPDR